MSRRRNDRSDQLRTLVAQEAARIVVQQGVKDYLLAKQKAAERMGLTDRSQLPKNTEIEQAVMEYQRLFAGDGHDARVTALRDHAKHAMRLMNGFKPRLVGSLLNGWVSDNTSVDIHLFADTVEEVTIHLMDQSIPFEEGEWHGRRTDGERIKQPRLRFYADDVEINLIVFPTKGLRQAPLSPVDGKPMRRATVNEIESLDYLSSNVT